MKLLEKILYELEKYPALKAKEQSNSITVFPNDKNGFPVRVQEKRRIYIVSFDQMRQAFIKNKIGEETAYNLFRFGLSESCRLKVFRKDQKDFKWEIEYKDVEEDRWIKGKSVALFFHNFLQQEEVRYLQNSNIIKDDLSDEYFGVKNEQDRGSAISFFLICSFSLLYYLFRKYDLPTIISGWLFLYPIIVLAVFLPLIGIHIWFDDRKLYVRRKNKAGKKELYYIVLWVSIWVVSTIAVWQKYGTDTLFGFGLLFWPFLFCIFLVPIFIFYQRFSESHPGFPKESKNPK